MDDTEMGRPARHARRHRSTQGGFVGDLVRKGSGESVRVRGKHRCECGTEMKVDFTGPEDSLGVRMARSVLEQRKCDACREREEEQARKVAEQQELVAAIRQRVGRSGVPARWQTLGFDTLREHPARKHQAAAIAAAERWARDGRGLVLHGEVGRGKTLIAAAAAVQRCAAGTVRFLSVAKLLMDLRMPFEAPEYERAQRRLEAGPRVALVLDDLDKLRPTEHQLQPLYVAINGFVEARQPLLVTANRNLEQMADWMGETFGTPIASRLAGYCEVIEIKGDDWRLS